MSQETFQAGLHPGSPSGEPSDSQKAQAQGYERGTVADSLTPIPQPLHRRKIQRTEKTQQGNIELKKRETADSDGKKS